MFVLLHQQLVVFGTGLEVAGSLPTVSSVVVGEVVLAQVPRQGEQEMGLLSLLVGVLVALVPTSQVAGLALALLVALLQCYCLV